MKKHIIAMVSLVSMSFWAFSAQAEWRLDSSRSDLYFVTTKAGNVAEVNQFNRLAGAINTDGQASLVIDLASVNTNIAIRDERLQEHLFEVDQYEGAQLITQVDMDQLNKLSVGSSKTMALEGQLSLHGQTSPVTTTVSVVKEAGGKLRINSRAPIIVNGKDFNLVGGIEKLREIAGLSAISTSVPVSFELVFQQQ